MGAGKIRPHGIPDRQHAVERGRGPAALNVAEDRGARLKAGLLDNQRGEHIVSSEAANDAGLLQQLTESFRAGFASHASSSITLLVFAHRRIFEPRKTNQPQMNTDLRDRGKENVNGKR